MSAHARWLRAGLVSALAALLAVHAYPIEVLHGDVVERAGYLRFWNETPATTIWAVAHLLEIWEARLLQIVSLESLDPLRALRLLYALAGAVSLGLLAGSIARLTGSVRLAAGAAAALLFSNGYWRICAGGEEKALSMLGMFAVFLCAMALAGELEPREEGNRCLAKTADFAWEALLVLSLVWGILNHLVVAVMVPALFVTALTMRSLQPGVRRRILRGTLLGTIVAGLSYLAVAGSILGLRSPEALREWFTIYHVDHRHWFSAEPSQTWKYPVMAVTGIISSLSQNPSLWQLRPDETRLQEPLSTGNLLPDASGKNLLVYLLFLILFVPALRLCWLARDRLPFAVRLAWVTTVFWCAHFLFYEPTNVESWIPLAPGLLLLTSVALHDRLATSPGGERFLGRLTIVLPLAVLALNIPVWRILSREPALIAGARALTIPSRSLVLCSWDWEIVLNMERWSLSYFSAADASVELMQSPVAPPFSSDWAKEPQLVAAVRSALAAGRQVFATDRAVKQLGPSTDFRVESSPSAGGPLLTIHRLLPP